MEFSVYKKTGRVFVLRFDEGDANIIKIIESFASEHKISSALITFLGALKNPGIVIGSRNVKGMNKPWWAAIKSRDGYEVLGFGTLFPLIEKNKKTPRPSVHLHLATGKKNSSTLVGCLRDVGDVYITLECVIEEIMPEDKKLTFVRRRRSDGVALLTKE